jgi:1-acyl-sn-glycerol-3-phosphate acyltransferase
LGGRIRLVLILALVVPLTAVMLPFQIVSIRRRTALRRVLPRFWHRMISRFIGLRVEVHGKPAHPGGAGVLMIANHVSWLDILALGAAAQVSFVAKDEVSGWPGVSVLAKLQETVFVNRQSRRTSAEQAARIRERLSDGDTVVLFPEGTTSDGNFLLPFKSSLFGAVGAGNDGRQNAFHVQPVAIVYTRIHGMPMGRFDRPVAAWPGDVELAPHALKVVSEGAIDVTIIFGEPFSAGSAGDRKALSAACEVAVRDLASLALRGRTALLSESKMLYRAAP